MQHKHDDEAGATAELADAAIAACDGDLRTAVRVLLVANNFLTAQNDALSAELEFAWQQVSPGFSRGTLKRRMKSGEPG